MQRMPLGAWDSLQRTAGNRAVARAIRAGSRPETVVQRQSRGQGESAWASAVAGGAWDRAAALYYSWTADEQERHLAGLDALQLFRLDAAAQRQVFDHPVSALLRIEAWVRRRPVPAEQRVAERLEQLRRGLITIDQLNDDEVRSLPLDDRVRLLSDLAGGVVVADDDERQIVRLLATTGTADRPTLVARLRSGGSALLRRLEAVVDGTENSALHSELRRLTFGALDPARALVEAENAPEIPWADPPLSQAARFRQRVHVEVLEWTSAGRLRLCLDALVGPVRVWRRTWDLDPLQLVAVRFLAAEPEVGARSGDVVNLPAVNLFSLRNKQFRQEMATVADVAALAMGGHGVIAAGSRAARLVAAVDLAYGAADLAVREMRDDLGCTAEGRQFLRAWDTVNQLVLVYGMARMVRSTPQVFRGLRDRCRGLESTGASRQRIQREVDQVLHQVEEVEQEVPRTQATAPSAGQPADVRVDRVLERFLRTVRRPGPSRSVVRAHPSRESFEATYALDPVRGVAPQDVGAFFRERPLRSRAREELVVHVRGALHLPPGATDHEVFHEMLHWASQRSGTNVLLGTYWNEGVTEWLARRWSGAATVRNAYDRNVRVVEQLAGVVGEDVMIHAYLDQRWRPLHVALEARLGSQAEVQRFFSLMRRVGGGDHGSRRLARALAKLGLVGAEDAPTSPGLRVPRRIPLP